MIQRFYKPIFHRVLGKPCIIYPARDESRLDTVLSRNQEGSIEAFVDEVINANSSLLEKASYLFAIPWNIEKQLLLDVWILELENKNESGPLVTAFTFKGKDLVKDIGTTSADGLIVLGYEETLRRRSSSLEEYLENTERQEILPDENRADEDFYK